MRLLRVSGPRLFAVAVLAAFCVVSSMAPAQNHSNPGRETKSQACSNDDSGLQLPAGFCATVFADDVGHARHMVVGPSGVVYVNTWSGEYYGNAAPHAGGFLVALQDKTGAGKADVIERFGETVQSGGAGGTGIGMYKGSIYAESNDRIVRYSLTARWILPTQSFPDCLWGAITQCIRLSSTPKDPCTSTSPPQPILASFKIGHPSRPARTLAPNL